MLGLQYFNAAGPNEMVAKFVNGKQKRLGKGMAFIAGPRTAAAIVPTDVQAIPFMFSERTADNQDVVVQGELEARFIPQAALEAYDLTVDLVEGAYRKDGTRPAFDAARNVLQRFVLKYIAELDFANAPAAKAEIQEKLRREVEEAADEFERIALRVEQVFIKKVDLEDRDLERALGAAEREKMLADQDRAIADRRQNAAEDERKLKKYEAETAQKLAEERTKLIKVENANKIEEATADAEAIKKRLEPYNGVDPATLFGKAMEAIGKRGVGELNITPDLLAALTRGRK